MRIGMMIDNSRGIDTMIEGVRMAVDCGMQTAWSSQVFGLDALTALAVVGREVPGIELGTAVIPTYPRHPLMLAAQALTTNAAIGNRLALGIGLSHKPVIENLFGYSFEKPVRHMREYLEALLPAMAGEHVQYQGETITARQMMPLKVERGEAPSVLIAALGSKMLELTGRVADGTITWMTGPATVESHITPSITKAAADAGRPSPRVVVGLPICVTDDEAEGKASAARNFAGYDMLPSYRAMLDREGAGGPGDVAIVGNEASVRSQLQRLSDGGCTDLLAVPSGNHDLIARTLALLAELAKDA